MYATAIVCELAAVSVESDVALPKDACLFFFPSGVYQLLHGSMPNKNAHEISRLMSVLKWEFFLLHFYSITLAGIYFWCLIGWVQ